MKKLQKEGKKGIGPDVRRLWGYQDLPIGITAIGFEYDMMKTGAWRSIRPVGEEKLAPCREACPAGIDIRGFVEQIRLEKFSKAYDLIQEENPLSRICGRVCFHPCESGCNRGEFDEPLSIRGLERFVSDASAGRARKKVPIGKRRKGRVAVIGSGPAGLSCAYYLTRMGYRVHLFEARSELGGLLRFGIPEYRLPKSVVKDEVGKILDLGITYETGRRLGENLNLQDLERYDAVFIGMGAWSDFQLHIPNRSGKRSLSGINFLSMVNTRSHPDMAGRIAIVGGGNTAIDVARSVRRLGGDPLIIYRRSRAEMPASPEEITEAEEEGIQFQFLTSLVGIYKGKNSGLTLKCIKNRLSTSEKSGRRTPIKIKGSKFSIPADRVIYALGQIVDDHGLPDHLKADRATATFRVDDFLQTCMTGVFAGGDAVLHSHSVASAIGSAKKAAIAIDRYLKGQRDEKLFEKLELGDGRSISIERYFNGEYISNPQAPKVVHLHDLNSHYFELQERIQARHLSAIERQRTFNEVNLGFTPDKALNEAERCFSCGSCAFCDNCYIYCPEIVVTREANTHEIDLDYCKGCGICANECPVGFIRMEPEANA